MRLHQREMTRRTRVKTNLTAGRMRLMFIADMTPNELRAIV